MRLNSLIGGHVERIEPSTALREAAQWMASRAVGSLLVTTQGRVEGIITEHDLTRAIAHNVDLETTTVKDWMTDYPDVATPEWSIDRAADVMLAQGFRHLPVMDGDGQPLGMVSIKDIVWAMRGTATTS